MYCKSYNNTMMQVLYYNAVWTSLVRDAFVFSRPNSMDWQISANEEAQSFQI